jgi:hypothetical protein
MHQTNFLSNIFFTTGQIRQHLVAGCDDLGIGLESAPGGDQRDKFRSRAKDISRPLGPTAPAWAVLGTDGIANIGKQNLDITGFKAINRPLPR